CSSAILSAQSSIVWNNTSVGTATLPATSNFNSLTQWRVEGRLHNVTPRPPSPDQTLLQYAVLYSSQDGTSNRALAIWPDGSIGFFANGTYCANVQLSGVTDIYWRGQWDSANGYRFIVWNAASPATPIMN